MIAATRPWAGPPVTVTGREPEMDWRQQAACRDAEDPEIFFPVSRSPKDAKPALAYCHVCPVRQECLDEELVRGGMQWGVRGGTTETERRAILRQKAERRPAYTCAVCGTGLPGRPSNGKFQQRYCSDECRAVSKRQRQAEYATRKKGVAA